MLLDGVFQGFENETDAQEKTLAPDDRQMKNKQNATGEQREAKKSLKAPTVASPTT